ncbi:PEP-CTERM sorting domain-containing protein [bacterium]|nr:PEP-CTERM sorting domain-containing protein [bacterium]
MVPEPSTNVMLLGVLVTLAFGLRRRQAARRITRPFSSAR